MFKQLRVLLVLLFILVLMSFVGALILMWYQHLDFLTALLGSVSMVTTIGMYTQNTLVIPGMEEDLLLIVVMIGGVSAVLALASVVLVLVEVVLAAVQVILAIVRRRPTDQQSASEEQRARPDR